MLSRMNLTIYHFANFVTQVLFSQILSSNFHNLVDFTTQVFFHKFYHSTFNILQILPSKISNFMHFTITW